MIREERKEIVDDMFNSGQIVGYGGIPINYNILMRNKLPMLTPEN
jgi:hypothetical protein